MRTAERMYTSWVCARGTSCQMMLGAVSFAPALTMLEREEENRAIWLGRKGSIRCREWGVVESDDLGKKRRRREQGREKPRQGGESRAGEKLTRADRAAPRSSSLR